MFADPRPSLLICINQNWVDILPALIPQVDHLSPQRHSGMDSHRIQHHRRHRRHTYHYLYAPQKLRQHYENKAQISIVLRPPWQVRLSRMYAHTIQRMQARRALRDWFQCTVRLRRFFPLSRRTVPFYLCGSRITLIVNYACETQNLFFMSFLVFPIIISCSSCEALEDTHPPLFTSFFLFSTNIVAFPAHGILPQTILLPGSSPYLSHDRA